MRKLLWLLFIAAIPIAKAQQVIPFQLGDDNRIYINVSVNNSETLSFIFDTGANTMVLNTSRVNEEDINITFNGTTENLGANGTSQQIFSANNTISTNGITVKNLDFVGIPYPNSYIFDGVIGWHFFRDKVVTIDFEHLQLIVSDALPIDIASYHQQDMVYINGIPNIDVTVIKPNGIEATFSAILDTGYNGELLVYYKTVNDNDLLNKFSVTGESTSMGTDGNASMSDNVIIPEIGIGNAIVPNVPAYLTKTPSNSSFQAILGGNILKRYTIIVDFKSHDCFLKPNATISNPF